MSATPVQKDSIPLFATVTTVCIAISQGLAWVASDPGNKNLQKLGFAAIGIQWIVYLIHASGRLLGNKPTERYYDFTGAATYISLTAYSMKSIASDAWTPRRLLLSSTVLIWSFRLGLFLFSRISAAGGIDSRFNDRREKFFRFWIMWTVQGLWVFLTALPVFTLNQAAAVPGAQQLQLRDYIGLSLWLVGFLFEVVADNQKSRFRSETSNHNNFIQSGLWSLSRHPNYFGEILLWIGVTLTATSEFTRPGQFACLISPVFVAFLLIKISGIPLLEAAADKKWSTRKDYVQYKKNVPVLVPFFG